MEQTSREHQAQWERQDTLDRFAAAALTGYLSSYAFNGGMPAAAAAAREAFDFAEAMMSERDRRNSDGSYKPRASSPEEAADDEG